MLFLENYQFDFRAVNIWQTSSRDERIMKSNSDEMDKIETFSLSWFAYGQSVDDQNIIISKHCLRKQRRIN